MITVKMQLFVFIYAVSANYIGTIIFIQFQINQNMHRLYFNGLMGAVTQL